MVSFEQVGGYCNASTMAQPFSSGPDSKTYLAGNFTDWEWTEGWAKAFSDGRITNPEYIDAGDIVIARFTVVGTNDGLFGSMKPTGRKMTLPFCEICHFDKQGKTASGGCYYDQYTLLTQLGHVQPLATAA